MLSWWDFFWQSFCNLVMHVSSMDFANDNIVSQLHKISMCMFSQPTSHRLDTSEFTMWCRTIHFIQCEPEKLKIGYPLFQPSCISMGDRMSLLDRLTVTDISQFPERPGDLPKGTHCWLYIIALPLALHLLVKMALVVYPVMAQAEVTLAGRQTAELGPTQDAENPTQILVYLWWLRHTEIGTIRYVPCLQGSMCVLGNTHLGEMMLGPFCPIAHLPKQCLQPW